MSDRKKVLELFEAQKELMTKTVPEGIEKHRKGDGRIRITDKNGLPIKNAKIKLDQKAHEFRFGANIFMLDELESKEKNESYKKYFSNLFNMATLPFYWDALEEERGKPRYAKDSKKVYRRPAPDLCVEFCEENGIEPREHALAYDGFFPKWLYDAPVEKIKREYERRCKEISERYADKIPTIEVTNEMKWDKGRTAFYNEPDFVEWCFKTARKYFPNNQLVINEWTWLAWVDRCTSTDTYYAYTEEALLKGTPIDAIGMQYHLFYKKEDEYRETRMLLDPENLYKHMDLYSSFGKPLQVTEVTVPSYSWEAEDEEIQAQIIENLYSVWFSHPAVEQIVYWNLVDGYAHVWDPDPAKIASTQGDMTVGENYYHGGLLRFDLSPKPAYFKIKELLSERWHTEAELVTDENGYASFRGFYGDYAVNISINEKECSRSLKLSKNKENTFELSI